MMDYEGLANQIMAQMRTNHEYLLDVTRHEDVYQLALNASVNSHAQAHNINVGLRMLINDAMVLKPQIAEKLYEIYVRSLLLDAPHYVDEYLLFLEHKRPVEDRFYQTRRKTLKPIVDAFQMLEDDELDELFVDMPPRTGKSSVLVFMTTHLMGKRPGNPNLYTSYSKVITDSFFNAVLEIMTDKETYCFSDVFPGCGELVTNAANTTIDVGAKRHYPSLTCRSIDGTLNGACDVDGGFAIADDLVSGYEEALSKDRLAKLWGKVSNNYIPRGKPTTKYIWVGTRWSLTDPEGMRLDLLQNGSANAQRRYKVVHLPALDENDESNFDYPFKKGFSTIAYHQIRENFERNNDMASWQAQYMGEPIEREGTLFDASQFSYFVGEIEEKPDRTFVAIDPAFGGGDYCAGIVCKQYGAIAYVVDVIFNNGDKRVTQPQIAMKAKKYKATTIQIEVNRSTEGYAEGLQKALKDVGYHCTVRTKNSSNQGVKYIRIVEKAPDIRDVYVFRNAFGRSKEYDAFMANVYAYSPYLGEKGLKKQHDDAPDVLAQGVDIILEKSQRYTIFQRPW